MNLGIEFSDQEPTMEADVVLRIDYNEEIGSAARAFEIAAELIHSLEDMDRVFAQSIHLELETALVVEDLEKSSLKIFLRNILRGIPDEALKDGDIKKMVGHYLHKAKYAALKYLDEPEDAHRSLVDLTEEIALLAKDTDLRHLPDYPPPNPSRLAQPLDRFQEAKRKFDKSEGLTVTLGKEDYSINLGSTWLPSEDADQTDQDKELVNEQDLYLIIGKPDFIGNAKWQFRHGRRPLSLKILDDDWIANFRSGKYPIKPGDALRVRMRVEHQYDSKGNLVSSNEMIVKVYDVIEGPESTPDLFEE